MTDLLLVPVMAHLSRICGGAPPKFPSFTDKALWGLAFAVITYVLLSPHNFITYMLCLGAGATACVGKLTGHGRGISLFEPLKVGSEPERVEAVILWALPYLPVWLYKCLVLTLCEAIVWSGMAVVYSPFIILCAVLRPISYLIGWLMWDYAQDNRLIRRTKVGDETEVYISFLPNYIGVPTAIGEFLTGALTGIVLGALI